MGEGIEIVKPSSTARRRRAQEGGRPIAKWECGLQQQGGIQGSGVSARRGVAPSTAWLAPSAYPR